MMKINQNVILKALTFLLCFYIAIMPIFQYKTVKASAFDKARSFTYIVVDILIGLKTVGFISDTTLTPENLENIYNKADAYLHENFGTELEYAEALRQVDQLGLDIASGKIFIPGNYSGKLWYSFLKGVVDVVWPEQLEPEISGITKVLGYFSDGYVLWAPYAKWNESINPRWPFSVSVPATDGSFVRGFCVGYKSEHNPGSYGKVGISFTVHFNSTGEDIGGYFVSSNSAYPDKYGDQVSCVVSDRVANAFLGNASFVPSVKKVTANKVKLPTRLPQTVINNINNYIDNSTENLIIAPTADELPQLPEDYNPSTDDPPDLPGYEDVTPDQPGITDPEPTPSPTPEPTPTPPEYDGSSWIKPIGDFFAGLLSFLKDALIPTQTVDFSPLQNMGADVSGKFPFSLPGDIGKLFGVLNAEPIRPHFEMDFDLSKVGIPGEPIHWDLNVEQWDNGAAVVKTALYIAFLIGLVFITKQFMQN